MAKIDLTGKRFGRLVVLKEDGRTASKSIKWLCQCDCGNQKTLDGAELRRGNVRSCGCFRREESRRLALERGTKEDLSGRKFGRWTVIRYAGHERWECQCECGTVFNVRRNSLVSGDSTTCKKCSPKYRRKSSVPNKGTQTRLYKVYYSMHFRCENPKAQQYKNYGARGISVCPEWSGEHGYENFREWAFQNGYDPKAPRGQCTIDRIDVNGNYEPANCRWADAKVQNSNMRRNRLVTYKGETKTISQWVEETGLTRSSLQYRMDAGWSVEDIFLTPLQR